MSNDAQHVTFVTFACSRDVHYAKALLGSIHHFYPNHPIVVVTDLDVPQGHIKQIRRFPNTTVIRVAELIGMHKLYLTGLLAKLNVFFLPGIQRAVVADADSVLVDSVLASIGWSATYTALNGVAVDLNNPIARQSYCTWAIDLNRLSHLPVTHAPALWHFVSGSHFAVDVTRFPTRLLIELLPFLGFSHNTSAILRAGDQGFWNYVANCWTSSQNESAVHVCNRTVSATAADRAKLSFPVNRLWIEKNGPKDFSFIHYVGFSRRYRRCDHVLAEALTWATNRYYTSLRLPRAFISDEVRRPIDRARDWLLRKPLP